VSSAISGDLDLDSLLETIMQATTTLIDAERSTLFMHDSETGELWSRVAQGTESKEIRLDSLLETIMQATTTLIDAERSTLFMHDSETGELWSRVAQGTESKEIRVPHYGGLAGAAFTTGETLNIPDAYADPRFNPGLTRNSIVRPTSKHGQFCACRWPTG
jgi:adenylate cyclase